MKKIIFNEAQTNEIINYYLTPHSLNDTAKFAGIVKTAIIKKLLVNNKVTMHSQELCKQLQQDKLNNVLKSLLNNQKLINNIKADYIDNNVQFKDMLIKYNLTSATFGRLLRALKIKKLKSCQTQNITKNKFKKYAVNKEELQQYYDTHTVEDTYNHFNIPCHFFYKILNFYEIDPTEHNKNIKNGSTPEDVYYKRLKEKYGESDIIRQYKEKRYPFHCDFYIPSEDLFIELNYHWTHGKHQFNPKDNKDNEKLNIWEEKAKTSNYYKIAIEVWTKRDPLKIKTAKKNKLNYKIIWEDNQYI